ncbi:3-deoxy-D-manno-octulosonate 8-phosphate phosphatase [Brumimicrobium salinarum]|uniref:3-deoxy-D-manno-octulosonate 8-phosphate phosphatase n=1 Tax=Brumimicrobium salinarum TaxID=2058658 RepID=A0A2I0R2V5_9FLAO|nr:HAD hydrolase family protein [Brumimicrobium salinarum]PKR80895.1 3-deoxy-D-manno-octulosonate 8-phosphate phosphatase [Brumimicrobium salinarum]
MSYKISLSNITTFIFDIDGVLTDGNVNIFTNEAVRALNSRDGYALQYAVKMGYKIFIISGGNSQATKERLLSAGVNEVILKASNKIEIYEDLKVKYKFKDKEALYMGDDIPDYNVMQKVGVAACPQDAAIEIKNIAHYQSPYNGGKHCVRDVIEQTLRVQDKWFKAEAHEW